MKKVNLILLLLLAAIPLVSAKPADGYRPLDAKNPIVFGGDHIIYQGKKIALNEKAFFVDGQLTAEEAAKHPFVFNSVNEAAKHLTDGTEANPMTLYIAPYVYWIDDPDDPTVRTAGERRAPYGLIIECDWLKFQGLTEDPRNVVLACNRGQTHGSIGNFTMFYIDGDGAGAENVTFGNYCNIDLEYPLMPKLNREKRASAIVQAQLVHCNGDKNVIRNSRFVSRLNLCPFTGGKRTLFDRCHFESTDDALCGTGVYIKCDLDFYGSKPFYATQGTGAIFLDCDMNVITKGEQYLVKAGSQMAIVDSRFKHPTDELFVGWMNAPTDNQRSYQYNVSLNGKPLYINADKPWLTVDMTGKPVLDAYRVEYDGKVIYNTYNLLKGDDDWDPMGVKSQILAAEKATGKKLTGIPTYIKVTPISAHVESGVSTAKLEADEKRFGNYEVSSPDYVWSVAPENAAFVTLKTLSDGGCEVIGTNDQDDTKTVVVSATTPGGLESASVLTVAPTFLEAPEFTTLPKLNAAEKGKLRVEYQLDLQGRADQSLITWYRCSDAKGNNPIEVAVSRLDQPEYEYTLTSGDVNYYIMVTVEPKHLRCHAGKAQTAISSKPVSAGDITTKGYSTDFQNFSVKYQPEIIPGAWTVDCYKPLDTSDFDWQTSTKDSWLYGSGEDNAIGTGLLQATKGARMLYTPVDGKYGDMTVTLSVDPCKELGQGFGSATGQYMDIYIKFDTRTLTGYALRIIRTTKYGNAVDFILMKYENGVTTEISDPVSSTCYRSHCNITLSIKGNKLTAHAETTAESPAVNKDPNLKTAADLEATVIPNNFGGVGIQHTGSTGASATMLHAMNIDWK